MPDNDYYSRRDMLSVVAGTLATLPVLAAAHVEDTPTSLAALEASIGGRVGVFAMDTGSGKILAHRADERFAMCSTFKWVLAAAVLAQVEHQTLSLDEHVSFGPADLLSYAPVTRSQLAAGFMSLRELLRAAVVVSDNTAANLLLAKLGGPSAVTQFARSCGDTVTRLDRNEPTLNSNEPNDPRDTSSPRAMALLMQNVLCGDRLNSTSRMLLLQWLYDCATGLDRLRAKLPTDWRSGDKTGTGEHNALNDVAIALPPDRPAIVIVAFLSESPADRQTLVAAQARIGELAAGYFQ